MKREDIEFKLKHLEAEEELLNNFNKCNSKPDKIFMIFSVIAIIVAIYITSKKEFVHAVDVFLISVLVCSIYNFLINSRKYKNDISHKLTMLEIEKKYYKTKLKMLDK